MTWTVERVGFAPIKGTHHLAQPEIALSSTGPIGDRRFCLVDPARGRALRTVQNSRLVAVQAQWDDPVLSCLFPDAALITDSVAVTETEITFDYWGRQVIGRIVDGPWAAAFGRYLDAELVLVACAAGDVVFGDAVSLVNRSSIDALARLLGRPLDPARWRATVVIDDTTERIDSTPDEDRLTDPAEAAWIGHRLAIGSATVAVTAAVARCAVIDIDPETGLLDGALLKSLGRTARRDERFGDPIFGVQGTVVRPGVIRPGDQTELIDPGLIDPGLIDPGLIDRGLIDTELIDPGLKDIVQV